MTRALPLDQNLQDLNDIPGVAPRRRCRYNRDQRVLVSILMIFALAIVLGLISYLASHG